MKPPFKWHLGFAGTPNGLAVNYVLKWQNWTSSPDLFFPFRKPINALISQLRSPKSIGIVKSFRNGSEMPFLDRFWMNVFGKSCYFWHAFIWRDFFMKRKTKKYQNHTSKIDLNETLRIHFGNFWLLLSTWEVQIDYLKHWLYSGMDQIGQESLFNSPFFELDLQQNRKE